MGILDEKIYYPDFKQKKECMKKLVKKAPEYKGIKIKIWILAVLCPISGFIILARLMLNPNYWILVNDGPGNFYIFIATMLFVMCPIFAYGVWCKRFYKCCEEIYECKEKYYEQTEDEVKFVYHVFESYSEACGNHPSQNTMNEAIYSYKTIRGLKYDSDTEILELKGAPRMERYWDYELGIKNEGPGWEITDDDVIQYPLCFDERNEFLDYLYEKIKDTVWEPIEVTWDSKVELSEWEE